MNFLNPIVRRRTVLSAGLSMRLNVYLRRVSLAFHVAFQIHAMTMNLKPQPLHTSKAIDSLQGQRQAGVVVLRLIDLCLRLLDSWTVARRSLSPFVSNRGCADR